MEALPTTAIPSYNDSESCMPKIGNKTLLIEGYGGIPETLAINSITWLLLLFLFAILRKFAWDYGRMALMNRTEENELEKAGKQNKYNVWTSLFYGERDNNRMGGSMESLDTQLYGQDRGFLSWIKAFFRVSDSDISKKCGQDAIQYLSFQRYLLVYLAIVCVLSTAVIIPINFTGNEIGTASDFGHTTIANLPSDSQLLWIHGVLSVVYILLMVFFMRHFSINLSFDNDDEVSRTLMISNIPKDKCFKNVIQQHFHEGYSEIIVEDVQFAYDVENLMALDTKRKAAHEARLICEIELSRSGHRPTLRPYKCGQCLCCGDLCNLKEVDAIDYYSEREERMKRLCEEQKAITYQKPLGIAFVTFETIVMAERIHNDFVESCKAAPNPQPSSIHNELDVVAWDVTYAPSPENIYWGQLSLAGWKWWMRAIIINTAILVLLFFLTTPTIVLNNLNKLNYQRYLVGEDSKTVAQDNILIQFLPTLLLWTFTALLPNLVYYSDQWVGHWTRTTEHHSVMIKTFIFLILMVLILPSLGLLSAKALFDFFILDHEKNLRWRCIFLSNNGAFFVNYVITSAFIGMGLELLRFSELFVYCMKVLMAKSSAERTSVRKHVTWEFQYGMQYAWMLCVFAVIMSYSLSCPLIASFGLVYMIMKHLVDRYNIYFAYKPSKISADIHATAINYVIIAVIFLQFNFVFFTVIRGGSKAPLSIFSICILGIILVIFFGRVCFGAFRNIGPLSRNKYKVSQIQMRTWSINGLISQFSDHSGQGKPEDNKPFVASVLTAESPNGPPTVRASDTLAQSYGTMESREPIGDPLQSTVQHS